MKKIVLIDMDGVLAENDVEYFKLRKHEKGFFKNKKPLNGAVNAFKELSKKYECHIVSTPVWGNPNCWKEKREWVEAHIGKDVHKRLTLTHTLNYGVDKFNGEHIHFGQEKYPDWESVLAYLI